jgi:hypothetical protein
MDLNRKILNLETEVLDLTREKRRADNKIEELEQALEFKGKLTYKAPYYWLEGDPEPYCAGCWPAKHLAVHVIETPIARTFATQKMCPSCKQVY